MLFHVKKSDPQICLIKNCSFYSMRQDLSRKKLRLWVKRVHDCYNYIISPSQSISQKRRHGKRVVRPVSFLAIGSLETTKLLLHLFSSRKRCRPFVRSPARSEVLISSATSPSPRIRSTVPLAVLQ